MTGLQEGVARVTDAPGILSGIPADGAGFARWARPHLSVLAALAAREVGRSDADDVVQETLVRAWRRRSTYDPAKGSPRAWLAAIVFDQTRRHRVRNVRRAEPFALIDQPPPEPAGEIEHAVTQLPRRQREVVTLHYLLDLPVREIAQVLGISEGSVKSHLYDARASLRLKLETTS
jgi:RNA polymerase sigma-70 factor (ECF subfamily)